CARRAARRASRRKRSRLASSSSLPIGSVFTATSRSSATSRARYTAPIPPRPSRRRTAYGAPRAFSRLRRTGSGSLSGPAARLAADLDHLAHGLLDVRHDRVCPQAGIRIEARAQAMKAGEVQDDTAALRLDHEPPVEYIEVDAADQHVTVEH